MSDSCIAKAMDAWRIRLWLSKGPRCPCGCSERVPWSAAKAAGATAFENRAHIPTARRPYWGVCHVEETYIPQDVHDFPAYLVERRHVVRTFSETLWQLCLEKTEDWMLALLKNGHATWLWRTPRCCSYQTPSKVFDLVKRDWKAAADIMLSWPTTVAAFGKDYLNYLVRIQPAVVFYEHTKYPLTATQRNWILHHPAMSEKTRSVRANKHWLFVLLWTGYFRSELSHWRKCVAPLPEPHVQNIPALLARIDSKEYHLCVGSRFYKGLLNWVAFLAKESPATVRTLLPKLGYKTHWLVDVIETLAPTGRIGLLKDTLDTFGKLASLKIQKEKIWQWAETPAFANPRIARTLLVLSTRVLNGFKHLGQSYKGLGTKILKSVVVVATIDRTAVWLSNKLDDKTLMGLTSKRSVVATALRTTPRFQALHRLATLQATVHLTLFFRNHVRLAQARSVVRGDCPICMIPKILQPLHGDKRHSMCLRCKRQMERKNMLDRCPICRTNL